MPNQMLTISLGQAGNQFGFEFWNRLCREHGIHEDGTYRKPEDFNHYLQQPTSTCMDSKFDCKDIFFNETVDERFLPRALLIDLEPRVINSIRMSSYGKIFDNLWNVGKDGGGASNNWANGFQQGKENHNEIFDRLNEEIESCDNFNGFIICHSVAGGTGSGLGSYILENLQDHYSKKTILAFSVLPNQGESSNVVIEPYNSLLTYRRLNSYTDGVVFLDNTSLYRVATNDLNTSPTFEDINKIIARQMCLATAMLRFPGSMYRNFSSVLSQLVSMPKLNFLMTSLAPLSDFNAKPVKLSNASDIIRSLKRVQNMLLYVHPKKNENDRYLGIVDILQGQVDLSKVTKAISTILNEKVVEYVDWRIPDIQVFPIQGSPYMCQEQNAVTGLMLANNTCLKDVFNHVLVQYDKLRKRYAYLEQYKRFDMFKDDLSEFDMACDHIRQLVEEYKNCLKPDYCIV